MTPVPLKVMLGCGAWMNEAMLDAELKPAAAMSRFAVNPAEAVLLIAAKPELAIEPNVL
mgnify:CR=1 FL=1